MFVFFITPSIFLMYNVDLIQSTIREEDESRFANKRSRRYVRAERLPHLSFLFRTSTECKDIVVGIDPGYQPRDKVAKGIPESSIKTLTL